MPYTVFSKDHETRGSVIIPYRDSINIANYDDIFIRNGLGNVDPDKWYPMQKLVDVFNELARAKSGVMMDFVSIGTKMGEDLQPPPELQDMTYLDLIRGLEQTYAYHNRGTDIGYIRGEVVSDNQVTVHYRCPFPDDLLYGSLWGCSKKFLPDGTHFVVKYDDRAKRMEDGGAETIIHVTW